MNGRIHAAKKPEDRIAAVARTLAYKMHEENGRPPDYADFREALRPYVKLELLRARIEEARMSGSAFITSRVAALNKEAMAIEAKLPPEEKS